MGTRGSTYLMQCTSYKAVSSINRRIEGNALREMLAFEKWLLTETSILTKIKIWEIANVTFLILSKIVESGIPQSKLQISTKNNYLEICQKMR